MAESQVTDDRRSFRAPDELWEPLLALAPVVDKTTAAATLRRLIQDYLHKYRVFWAEEHPDIDPEQKPVPWYECEECGDVHRLIPGNDPRTQAPWGCSVTKSFQDRLEKEKENQ